jgi:phage antirepressor YoqD-like protein
MLQLANQSLTMTSLEIADLVEKRHDNVKRTIETLVVKDVIQFPQFEEIPTATKPTLVFKLTKRDCFVVVAQLCPEFTARIVDRWQELESQQAPKLPSTYKEALIALVSEVEAREQAEQQLALAAPKVEFVDKYVAATGNLGFRQVAKLLKVKEPELRDFLVSRRIMYRLAGTLTPYADHIEAGRFEVKAGVADHGDSSHAYSQAKFTPKGVEWLAGELAKHQARKAVAASCN